MKTRELHRELRVPAPLEEVFAFFAEPRNLAELTPPRMGFTVLEPVPPMRAGAILDYRVRVWGVPLAWRSEITAYEPPSYFVDEQRRGPYRLWRHEHRFTAVPGGTQVSDRIVYAPRGGSLVAGPVRRELDRIFDFRSDALRRRFGGGAVS
jgi:ligand-binding SRPBCC domain-containing protein